ncbi:MAG: hypothetical protein AB9900_13125 [Humidesulfovibrio sp.]
MPYTTDERLKSFLDTNQLHREQMCLAILSIDKRFSDVRPRHPRGGPDGGRDIEATFRGDQRAYGAVGFANQADDTDEKKKRISGKFRADLQSALDAEPTPSAFVFLTNINLTIGEKDDLSTEARAKGFVHCEIFDRERLRIALDSPDGLAIRFQYLDIPLSDAEQATFFARWGDDIQSVIATGFQRIENTLERLLFLQEATHSLLYINIVLELDRSYSAEEIGHFRSFCHLHLKEVRHNIYAILFGSSDKSDRMRSDIQNKDQLSGIKYGMSGGQWEQHVSKQDTDACGGDNQEGNKYIQVGSSSSIGLTEVKRITISYNRDSLMTYWPMLTLRDLDGAFFLPFLNASLAEKVRQIHVFSNEYKLLELNQHEFNVDSDPVAPSFPVAFSQSELEDPWVRIRPVMASCFFLLFSEQTPLRFFAPRKTENTFKR